VPNSHLFTVTISTTEITPFFVMWSAIWGSDDSNNKCSKRRNHTELLLLKMSVNGKQYIINISGAACVNELKDLIKANTDILNSHQALMVTGRKEPLQGNATLGTEGLKFGEWLRNCLFGDRKTELESQIYELQKQL
jgi:hypothetical protein